MNRFHAGLLRQRILIEKARVSRNAHGENVQAWSEHAWTHACVTARGGNQISLGQGMSFAAVVSIEFRLRFRNDIQIGQHRLAIKSDKDGTRYFRIDTCYDPDGKRRETRIIATEVKA